MNKNKSRKTTTICLCIILIILSIVLPNGTFCATSNITQNNDNLVNSVIEELDNVDFSGLNEALNELSLDNSIFNVENVKAKVYEIISGNSNLDFSSLLSAGISVILKEIVSYLPLLSLIVAIGVLSNLLGGVKSKFNEKSTSNLIHLVCFLASAVIVIGVISNLTNEVGVSIKNIVKQINIIFPILITLMLGLGANVSVSAFQPVVAIMSTYVADFFSYFIVPLFLLSFVFDVVGNINDNVKLDKFNEFIMSLFKWSVGLIFTIFFAVFAVQGLSAGSFDNVSIRTTKYTIKSYIPFIGSYLADGMDLILASTMLIKNAVGLLGIIIVLGIIFTPIIKIALFSLMLKLVTAVLQPMGNKKLCGFLSSTSKSVTMLSSALLAISFMYILSLGMVMLTANVVV